MSSVSKVNAYSSTSPFTIECRLSPLQLLIHTLKLMFIKKIIPLPQHKRGCLISLSTVIRVNSVFLLLLWHVIYFFSFLYLTSCITTAVTWLTTLLRLLFLFTYDSLWLITNTLLWLSIGTYYSLTHYDSILYFDSGWVVYCTLTHNESFTYCSWLLL